MATGPKDWPCTNCLLCWRYLRTRYIALASIISVTLGVATMIVVNSVMAGFTHEMQDRIHGILSDVVFETPQPRDGFPDAELAHGSRSARWPATYIEGMTPTVVVPAMLSFQLRRAIGAAAGQLDRHRRGDARPGRATSASTCSIRTNRRQLSFELRDDGYDVCDHQAGAEAHRARADE